MCYQATWQDHPHFSQEYITPEVHTELLHSLCPLFHEVLSFCSLSSNLCPFINKEEMVSHYCEVELLHDPGCQFRLKEQV